MKNGYNTKHQNQKSQKKSQPQIKKHWIEKPPKSICTNACHKIKINDNAKQPNQQTVQMPDKRTYTKKNTHLESADKKSQIKKSAQQKSNQPDPGESVSTTMQTTLIKTDVDHALHQCRTHDGGSVSSHGVWPAEIYTIPEGVYTFMVGSRKEFCFNNDI